MELLSKAPNFAVAAACLLRQAGYFPGPVLTEHSCLQSLGERVSLVMLHVSHLEGMATRQDEATLLPQHVAPRRREEFLLGRCAARFALRKAGLRCDLPVLRGSWREPCWPDGFVGSITHCEEWAVAAAVRAEDVRSIGIDLENSANVAVAEIIGVVSTETERAWVLRGGDAQRKLALLFSAKESLYKALFPLCRQFFDFHAVELRWCSERDSFLGVLRTGLSEEFRAGNRLEVGCQNWGMFVFTHAVIAH